MTKSKLPIKIRIAFWWLFITTVGWTTASITLLVMSYNKAGPGPDNLNNVFLLLGFAAITYFGVLFFTSAFLLRLRNKTAHIFAIAILVIQVAVLLVITIVTINVASLLAYSYFLTSNIFYLIPIILVLYDRSKYWVPVSTKTPSDEPGGG